MKFEFSDRPTVGDAIKELLEENPDEVIFISRKKLEDEFDSFRVCCSPMRKEDFVYNLTSLLFKVTASIEEEETMQ